MADPSCTMRLRGRPTLHAAEQHDDVIDLDGKRVRIPYVRAMCQGVWRSPTDVDVLDYRYRDVLCRHAACRHGFQHLDANP